MKIKLFFIGLASIFIFSPVFALAETSQDPVPPVENLRINEIMYAPDTGSGDEWVEIENIGTDPVTILTKGADGKINKIIDYKSPEQRFEGITKNALNFTFLRLKWKGKIFDAGIAHSFPRRDLPNAYDKMAQYGKLCANYYLSQLAVN